MNAGDADIADGIDLVAHDFGRELCLFQNRKIAGAGADHRDFAFAVNGAGRARRGRHRKREIFGFRMQLLATRSAIAAVARVSSRFCDLASSAAAMPATWSGVFPLPENHFGHAVPKGAMVVDFGEPQILKRQMAQAVAVQRRRRDSPLAHLFQEAVEVVEGS